MIWAERINSSYVQNTRMTPTMVKEPPVEAQYAVVFTVVIRWNGPFAVR